MLFIPNVIMTIIPISGKEKMMSLKLLELDRTIRNLSLAEQQWLLDRLTQQVDNKNQSISKFSDNYSIEGQLPEMAKDPDIERKNTSINQNLEIAEFDVLEDL